VNFETTGTLAVGTGYVAVVDSNWLTICWALATPAEVPLLAAEPVPGDVLLELPDELHAASAATPVITIADDSHRLPGRLIALPPHSSSSRPSRER
jgi:hypothetical protein